MSSRAMASRTNLVQYVYTLGVMVTGVFLGQRLGGFDSPSLWTAVFAVSLGWIAYHHFVIVPRFDRLDDRGEGLRDHGD